MLEYDDWSVSIYDEYLNHPKMLGKFAESWDDMTSKQRREWKFIISKK